MLNTIKSLSAVSILLAVAIGCGGETAPPAPDIVIPPPPAYDPLKCPEGSTYRESETPQGVEQVCETAGVLHGPFRRWFSEDLKAVDGGYERGQPDGAWVWWYANGNKKSKGAYKDGKQVGSWTWWTEGGVKIEEGDFLSGRKVGTWTTWYESTMKQDEGMYHNGVKNSTWQYFRDDAENTVKRREKWQAGAVQKSIYYDLEAKEIKEPLPEDVAPPEGEGAEGVAPTDDKPTGD